MDAPKWFLKELRNIDPLLFPKLCRTDRGQRWVIYRYPEENKGGLYPPRVLRPIGEIGGHPVFRMIKPAKQVTCPMEDENGNYLPLCGAVLRVLRATSCRRNWDKIEEKIEINEASWKRHDENTKEAIAREVGSYARAKATPHVLNAGVPG